MVALKKQILNCRLKKLIAKYVFVLFYQLNHGDTKQWRKLKQHLAEIGNVESFLIKNQVACKVLTKNKQDSRMLTPHGRELYSSQEELDSNQNTLSIENPLNHDSNRVLAQEEKNQIINKIDTLFQGPTFVIACESIEEFTAINVILKQYYNLFLIGGISKENILTHLDFNTMLELDKSIYGKFCQQCINPIYSILLINQTFNFQYLKQKQYEFLLLLQQICTMKN